MRNTVFWDCVCQILQIIFHGTDSICPTKTINLFGEKEAFPPKPPKAEDHATVLEQDFIILLEQQLTLFLHHVHVKIPDRLQPLLVNHLRPVTQP